MTEYRSGFASIVGRPNAGKSTLVNAMVGAKVAITSDRPQTTRRIIRGIVTNSEGQLILVDTPGLHRPRTLLGERLNDQVHEALASVDVIGFCMPADQEVGAGDRFIAAALAALGRTPVIALVTKTDTVSREVVAERLTEVVALGEEVGLQWKEIVPLSSVSRHNIDTVTNLLIAALPVGPKLYPDDDISDQELEITVAELIREAALDGVQEEMPHSIAVVVEEIKAREDRPANRPLTDVRAEIYVERPTQKAIMIGAKGSRLKTVGTRARKEIEVLLGTPIFLDLHVRVAKDWQKDPKQLRRLGF
ncbi:MAG: GTPase Era [Candidatus Nanopelagicales bacterium]|jgi:GTPase|nr:GTPase Era [Candidatus Nanopelagicales bacterium]